MPNYGFEMRAFDCDIRVATDSLETYTVLERYVFPSFPKTANATYKADIFIRIDRVAEQFHLSVDGVMVSSAAEANILVPDLIRALDDVVIRRLTELHAVHAGAVLLRRGATYFSDEYALIDSAGRVHPYPRPLLLRNGSPEQSPWLPAECNAYTGDSPVPVGWILSLEYSREYTWNVAAVCQSEALLILLRNTPHILSESPNMVAAFQHAVGGAQCYVGRRPEADEAVSRILQLVGSPL
jgi:hypothetical protein